MNPTLLAIIEFGKIVLQKAPDLRPKVEEALREWANIRNVNPDQLIQAVRPAEFKDIRKKADAKVDKLDLPEGEPKKRGK